MENTQEINIDKANVSLLNLIRLQELNQDTHDMLHACREALYNKAKEYEILQRKVTEMEILFKAKQEEIAALKMTLNG